MKTPTPTALLACDLDGTVSPVSLDETYPALLSEFRATIADDPGIALIYVTGRRLDSALELIAARSLPLPRLLCCDVGSSVHRPEVGGWIEDPDYAGRMADGMRGRDAAAVLDLLADVPLLAPQPPQNQGRWKASFTLPDGAAGDDALAAARARLAAADLPLRLVRSACVFERRDLLDVLPEGVDKATAVAFAAENLGVPTGGVVYAGDSHNDLDALLAADRAVVVANAPDAVRAAVRDGRDPATTCLAAGAHMAGVLEGMRAFGIR